MIYVICEAEVLNARAEEPFGVGTTEEEIEHIARTRTLLCAKACCGSPDLVDHSLLWLPSDRHSYLSEVVCRVLTIRGILTNFSKDGPWKPEYRSEWEKMFLVFQFPYSLSASSQ